MINTVLFDIDCEKMQIESLIEVNDVEVVEGKLAGIHFLQINRLPCQSWVGSVRRVHLKCLLIQLQDMTCVNQTTPLAFHSH